MVFFIQGWYWGMQVGDAFLFCHLLCHLYFVLYVMYWLLSNPSYRLQQAVAIILVFFFSFAIIFCCIFLLQGLFYCQCSSMHFGECRIKIWKLTINHICWLFLPCNVLWDYCFLEINNSFCFKASLYLQDSYVLKLNIRKLPGKSMFIGACICYIWPCSLLHMAYIWPVSGECISGLFRSLLREQGCLILPSQKYIEQCWQ